MEDLLRVEAQAKLAAIVESSDDAIISKTLDGIITTWNAGAQRIFGYTANEVVGRPLTMLIPPDRLDEERMILATLRRGERIDHLETIRLHKDGQPIHVSVTSSPILDRSNRVIGISKIARDITARKEAERALREARDAAEAASHAKDQFLSVLSHELRTPLTPVLGAVSFIEQHAALPPVLRGQIEMVRRNVETEARLVDDLLDLTRLAQGKVELFNEAVDAHAAITNVMDMLRQDLETAGLHLSARLEARRRFVWADPGRLQQVLMNLLSNAIKYTPRGGRITITTGDEGQQLRIEVQDTGIGIAPEALPRLFEPFEQGTQAAVHPTGEARRGRGRGAGGVGGLGLGLSIVKSLAEMHKGSITAASPGPDRGSTFALRLPTVPEPATDAEPPSSRTDEGQGCRILFVEDHADTRYVMSLLLQSFGCVVSTAGSVKEAVDLAGRERFDLLVSDIGLPDGTGMDVMRYVADHQQIRGIALSGYGQDADRRRSEEAGFSTHLVKPVNLKTLQQAIEELVG